MARSRGVPVSGVPEAPAAAVSRFLAEPGLGARRPSAQCGHGCFCACSHDPPLEAPLGPRGIVAFKALCGIRAPRGVGRSASMSLQRRPIVTFFTAVTATSSRLRGCAPGPAKRADCRPNVGLGWSRKLFRGVRLWWGAQNGWMRRPQTPPAVPRRPRADAVFTSG